MDWNEFVNRIIELGPSPYREMMESDQNKELVAMTSSEINEKRDSYGG